MGLAHDDIRAVITRAGEIQNATAPDQAEIEALIQAAAEVGIERSAVERALRERMATSMALPAVGDLTFAKSADDKFYAAEVVAVTNDTVRVQFMRGGVHTVSVDELRPFSLLPGERVVVQWPWWGPWTCSVLSYDAAARYVTVTDGWGETRIFPLSEIWLAKPKAGPAKRMLYAGLIGFGVGVGGAIGAIITALVMR